jgi:hypothetical protein
MMNIGFIPKNGIPSDQSEIILENTGDLGRNEMQTRVGKIFRNRLIRKEIQGFISKLFNQYLWIPYKDTWTRATLKGKVKVDFAQGNLPQKTIESLTNFNRIDADHMAKGLTKEQANLLYALYIEAVNENRLPDPEVKLFIKKIINASSILKKPFVLETLEDWATLDKIEFFLTQRYFVLLCDVFNSDAFENLSFVTEMKNKFRLDWREKMVAEALSRKIAYTGNLDGKSIFLPVFDQATKHYALSECRITLFPLGENLPSYIIDPLNKASSPWLVVRGTVFSSSLDKDGHELRKGSFESKLADTYDPKSIGNKVVNYSMVKRKQVSLDGQKIEQLTLADLIEKFEKERRPLIVTGHSLGGNIANIIGIRFFHKIKKVYGDDPPAVCKKMHRLWKARMEEAIKNAENPIEARKIAERKITNFMCEGSMIPGGGLKVVGLNLAVMPDCFNMKKKTLHYHSLHLSTIGSTVKVVDNEAENAKHVRIIMERIRKIGGWFMSLLVRLSRHSHTPNWWSDRKLIAQTIKKDKNRFGQYTLSAL